MNPIPPQAVLTATGFVNTWECDENDHLNVQFYARAFEHAFEVAAVRHGGTPGAQRLPGFVRHVRYHSELRVSRRISVHSARIADGPHAGKALHLLMDVDQGVLSATALDSGFAPQALPLPEVEAGWADPAVPRGLPPGPDPTGDMTAFLERGAAVIGNLGIIGRAETDAEGRILLQAIVSRFSDSAAHVWGHAGIGEEWLTRHKHGRVAVEMKLTMLGDAGPGSALRMVSRIDDVQERTFAILHQLEHVSDGAVVATGSVRALVMDLQKRRASPLPAEIREISARNGAKGAG